MGRCSRHQMRRSMSAIPSLRGPVPSHSPLRPIDFAPPDIFCEHRADGSQILRSRHPLGAHEPSLAALFRAAVAAAPARVFLAERDENGGWRKITYAEARTSVDALA